ncbi:hypothetical protein [Pectobacterium carotovorum]|uniref:hypothetical protein n=1 Tax=Pectobacterium carotovorum TaxID=554 RepID=UPI002FFFF777
MTTTAYDCDNNVVASDTRWSADLTLLDGKHILYADDTGFNKIAHRLGGAIFCAGDGLTIEKLKTWWLANPFDPENLPDLKDAGGFKVSVMVVSSQGDKLFDAGPKQALVNPEDGNHVHAVFSGSGGPFAGHSFMQCGCVKTAVTIAKAFDPYSGGEVKFCNVTTGDSNLHDETMDYNSIMNAMRERGILMKYTGFYAANSESVQAIPLKEHPEYTKISGDLMAGTIRAYAPMGGAGIEWNEQRINNLKEAARKIAALEEKMKA